MTMTQKILAKGAGLDSVKAGQLIMAKLDLVLGNDITSPVAINEFEKSGFSSVFDREKIAMVMDHFVPNKDIKAAEQTKQVRDFADEKNIEHFYAHYKDWKKDWKGVSAKLKGWGDAAAARKVIEDSIARAKG